MMDGNIALRKMNKRNQYKIKNEMDIELRMKKKESRKCRN
jgi:hypothetical protein